MKTICLLVSIAFFSLAGFGQNMNTSASMTLPNVVAAESDNYTFGEPEQSEEVNIDDLFDKVAMIESILFSEDEILNKHEEHMLKDQQVQYFKSSN